MSHLILCLTGEQSSVPIIFNIDILSAFPLLRDTEAAWIEDEMVANGL